MCAIVIISTVLIITVNLILAGATSTTYEDIHVNEGQTIILHCKSNDDDHNFLFWHLVNSDTIIGPRNYFNAEKFHYEVMTGNLTIWSITSNEAGLYSCISDGLDKRDILAHSVNLVLKKDWEDVILETNHTKDYWKLSAVLASIFVFLLLVLIVIIFCKRERARPKYFDISEQNDDEDEEDSAEELFTREPSTSGIKNISNKVETSDNFEKVYSAINTNNT